MVTLTEYQACTLGDRKEVVIVRARLDADTEVEVIVDRGAGLARRLRLARKFAAERVVQLAEERELTENPGRLFDDLTADQLGVLSAAGWGADEVDAAQREICHLFAHRATDETFKRGALTGPCFCAGKFQCTRCQLTAGAS